MNNKKILLGLLFLSTKNYLKDPILTLNNQKDEMPIVAKENAENNEEIHINEQEEEEEA